MTWMSQAAYARRHGVSPKTATKWKQSGLIVVTEEGVDVEASDERLRKYRFAEDGRAQRGKPKSAPIVTLPVTRGAHAGGNGGTGNAAAESDSTPGTDGRLVELPVEEIRRRLHALDWTQPAPKGKPQLRERARVAARCVGFEAVESELQDDGHWGGFQLRDPAWWGNPDAYPDQEVVGGFGFELVPLEVLRLCRLQAALEEDGWDGTRCLVDLALLPALAYPHYEGQRPQPSDQEVPK